MNRAPLSVVKVGGSLLATAEFPQRLRTWLGERTRAQRDTHIVVVAGGGKWVDAIRELDARSPLGDERAHWICVDAMDVTAGLVGAMLPELCTIASFDELEHRLREPGVTLLRLSEFVARIEPTRAGTKLPADWSVTSDSIAARLAIVLGADELVLLKSVPPPITCHRDGWLDELAAAGYVDNFLPTLRDELPPVQFCELPSPENSS
jgi:aspartokinase-like uncharacterized kinase